MTPPTTNQMGKVLDYLIRIDEKIEKLDAKQDQMALDSNAQSSQIRQEIQALREKDENQEKRLNAVEDSIIEQRQFNKLAGWIGGLIGSAIIISLVVAFLMTIGLPT